MPPDLAPLLRDHRSDGVSRIVIRTILAAIACGIALYFVTGGKPTSTQGIGILSYVLVPLVLLILIGSIASYALGLRLLGGMLREPARVRWIYSFEEVNRASGRAERGGRKGVALWDDRDRVAYLHTRQTERAMMALRAAMPSVMLGYGPDQQSRYDAATRAK
jgi:hypothetical protein